MDREHYESITHDDSRRIFVGAASRRRLYLVGILYHSPHIDATLYPPSPHTAHRTPRPHSHAARSTKSSIEHPIFLASVPPWSCASAVRGARTAKRRRMSDARRTALPLRRPDAPHLCTRSGGRPSSTPSLPFPLLLRRHRNGEDARRRGRHASPPAVRPARTHAASTPTRPGRYCKKRPTSPAS